ncbi:MAG TPA: flagellar biosynthetic protein FliQ [Egibacteraceae bacterium]|jgi:flagellar biosynthesis protein FliQ|nr:flagellar biosynthetic protein FliQ [Egibacteraceae bacterium]
MTDAQVLQIVAGALMIAAKLAAPILVVSLAIGVVVSLVQTVTQVQEMTLTFVPKLVGVALIVMFGGSWMIRELVTWVTQLWSSIPSLS